jgi:putative sigma-54 modulation protein
MNVYKLVGRNLEITDGIRSHIEQRLSKLERFEEHIVDARVVLSVKNDGTTFAPHRVEMQLNVPHGVIRAEEARQDMYVAIDAATEVLERQLKKFRSKFITRSQRGELPVESQSAPQDDEDMEVQIVRNKKFELRPMSPEDAAMQMEALAHDFYMFFNAKTNQVNVIYKRRDGHYGLLEPHIG